MKNILWLILYSCMPVALLAQGDKPRTFTDNGKKYVYTDSGGITASFIAYYGDKFSVDSFQTPGGEFLMLSHEGQVTVYNFWFVACKPCIAEIPALNQLAEKYKGEPIQFVAITFDNAERIGKFLEKTPFNFMIGILSQEAISKIKKISYYPFTAIVDKKQRLRFVYTGRPVGKNPAKEIFDILDPQVSKALKQ